MGCFEKVIGSILGLIVAFVGIVGFFNSGSLSSYASWFFLIQGLTFTGLNLILDFDNFMSFENLFTQSDFGGVISKWCILAIISCIVAWIVPSLWCN